jgi:hypothetical protein
MMTEAIITLEPTILLWVNEAEGIFGALTARKDGIEALIVFRNPEDARCYQEESGNHTAAEGFQCVGVGPKALAALLEKHGLETVAMPEEWTSAGAVDLFDAGDFVQMLEESPAE